MCILPGSGETMEAARVQRRVPQITVISDFINNPESSTPVQSQTQRRGILPSVCTSPSRVDGVRTPRDGHRFWFLGGEAYSVPSCSHPSS